MNDIGSVSSRRGCVRNPLGWTLHEPNMNADIMISLFFLQILNFEPRDEIRNAFFGMTATNSTPCLRAKYKNTQRTTSPVRCTHFNWTLTKH